MDVIYKLNNISKMLKRQYKADMEVSFYENKIHIRINGLYVTTIRQIELNLKLTDILEKIDDLIYQYERDCIKYCNEIDFN